MNLLAQVLGLAGVGMLVPALFMMFVSRFNFVDSPGKFVAIGLLLIGAGYLATKYNTAGAATEHQSED